MSKVDPVVLRTLTISDEAARLIRSIGYDNFQSSGQRLPDGNWSVPFDDEVIQHVDDQKLPGETVSDTIIRLIRLNTGVKPS